MQHRRAAIVCSDSAGYSRLIGADEAATLKRCRAAIEQVIARHDGWVMKTIGDDVPFPLQTMGPAPRLCATCRASDIEEDPTRWLHAVAGLHLSEDPSDKMPRPI